MRETTSSEIPEPLHEINHTSSKTDNVEPNTYDLVVFCHLRWDFVYQRPQHIVSRLAKTYRVLLVEEPIHYQESEAGSYELEAVSENLHVLKPKVGEIKAISDVLKSILKTTVIEVGWFYSPAFSVLIEDFKFDTIIYDCMDELSLFKGAARELIDQEKYLLSQADVVFTGGKALFESKSSSHDNVHCFPSSVDRDHFALALTKIPIPEDIGGISTPIVGYFGVIDERIDLELLYDTAKNLPHVSFVMIGPLAKIEDKDLPQNTNIHYLGMKDYPTLPNYLKAFDIAMMPFALNDATRYISPTKTLEYMAAGVPIISTAIKDVVRDYEHCVHIISSVEEFTDSINDILYEKNDRHNDVYETILAKTSWNVTVEKMKHLIKEKRK